MLRRRPVVVRREPGLFSTMAHTAAVDGQATVAAKGGGGTLERDAAGHAAPGQQMEAAAQPAEAEQLPPGGSPPQPAYPPPTPEPALAVAPLQDRIAQLQHLGELKEAGMLTEEEFQSQKERILSN